ncbi:MAG: hypothetical protein ACI9YT_002172 [Halobacteriales archaeon]|jgi:hypothetical protein
MEGQDLVDLLRSDHETALAALGSSTALYAVTGGTVDAEHVHAAVSAELAAAERGFESWGRDESNDRVASLFETTAATVADNRDAIGRPDDESEVLDHEFGVPSFDGTADRLGGLLGWTLVATAIVEQAADFFAGHADPDTADTYRDVRDDLEHLRDRTATAIELDCESDGDWSAAEAAANDVIEAAFGTYRETLASLDVDPDRT